MVEPALRGYMPPEPFGIDHGAPIHEIMRLLTGSINILDRDSAKTLCLTRDELRSGQTRKALPERIIAILFDDPIAVADYATFVVTSSRRNLAFFSKLRDEIKLCLICKKTQRYTESFLYLYRILEFISTAFPFLYASTQRSFVDGHRFLKSLVADDKGGELKVLETALPALVGGSDLARMSFDFNIAGSDIDFVRALKRQLQNALGNSINGMDYEREGDILFTVPFLSMSTFMVALRNRMFHYKPMQKNLDLGELGGSERVLRICLDEFVYWFALTFTEVTRALAKQALRREAA